MSKIDVSGCSYGEKMALWALGLTAAEVGRMLNVSGQSVLKSAEKAGDIWDDLEWLTDGLAE